MRSFSALKNILLFLSFLSFSIANAQKTTGSSGSDFFVNSKFTSCLLPMPQKVSLSSKTFSIDNDWTVEGASNIENKAAFESLSEGLKEKEIVHKLPSERVTSAGFGGKIRLIIRDGAVPIGQATDTDRIALSQQAYRLVLSDTGISITANASQGLFYGVQTLLQLIRSQKEKVLLPEGEIVDWPDLNVRMIYWDDAHHLEKMDALKGILRQAAYYKINAFSIKLEGHFQYKSAPAIVEPYALTTEEYRELSNYAKARYIELVPYLDAPAHVAFILKHPEYAHLRAFPNSNYEFSVTNPETDTLLFKMFGELINASPGGKHILLSTDEAYYVGKAKDDQKEAEALGGRGRLLAKFTARMAEELYRQGRRVIFWGEYPLTSSDIPTLPSYLINGVYDSSTASKYRENKMRQFIYTYTQGEESLFPSYYPMSSGDSIADATSDRATGRVEGMLKTISSAVAENKSDLMGVFVAGWADAGLHPETFWLGYATGAACGWNHKSVTAADLKNRFYKSFYGAGAIHMDKAYELLSRQAQFYDDSWEWGASNLRKPIFGNHAEIYKTPKPARDQTLPALPVPSAKDLSVNSDWSKMNKQRLQSAQKFLQENRELTDLLHQNLRRVGNQHYNLEVLLSVALLCKQNLTMLLGLNRIDKLMQVSSKIASKDPSGAVSSIDQALNEAELMRKERNKTLQSVITIWYKQWHPRVEEANGRRYLNEADDVKDHRPERTIDMTYLIYRDLHYPLDKWADEVQKGRNEFAAKNRLPIRRKQLTWEDTN